jgi:NAD(P)-dependent dehydrogenase (short-subunit alcohol dehydrogenase family)
MRRRTSLARVREVRVGQDKHETVVITGATGNVGGALVQRLLGKVPLALPGQDMSRLAERVPVLLARGAALFDDARVALLSNVDVNDEASVAAGMARARNELGPIRALVHTVGAWAGGTEAGAQSLDDVKRMLDVNFLSAVHLVKAVLPDLLAAEHGRIILFSSADALHGRAGASAYAASKAALLRYAEALAEEITPKGVGVRVIIPTTIDTPANRAAMPKGRFDDWVKLEEVASTVEFLLSPESAGMRFALVPLGR